MVSFRERVATHEAGHCVAALTFGIPILSVTIDQAPNMHRGAYRAEHACGLEYLTVLCLAELRVRSCSADRSPMAATNPICAWRARIFARHFDPLRAAAELARCRDLAQRLVRSVWAEQRIRVLADALLRCGTLSGEEIHQI